MLKSKILLLSLVIVLLTSFYLSGVASPNENKTFEGKLAEDYFTDYYYLRTDEGPVYRLFEDDIGIEMIEMVGSRVSIFGTLVDTDDGIFLKVFLYKF